MVPVRVRKSRPIIATADVPRVFDDACITSLAKTTKLPPQADLSLFAAGVREAARIFAIEARNPSANALHDEIGKLHRAADRRRYDQLATLMERLSPQARA